MPAVLSHLNVSLVFGVGTEFVDPARDDSGIA